MVWAVELDPVPATTGIRPAARSAATRMTSMCSARVRVADSPVVPAMTRQSVPSPQCADPPAARGRRNPPCRRPSSGLRERRCCLKTWGDRARVRARMLLAAPGVARPATLPAGLLACRSVEFPVHCHATATPQSGHIHGKATGGHRHRPGPRRRRSRSQPGRHVGRRQHSREPDDRPRLGIRRADAGVRQLAHGDEAAEASSRRCSSSPA